MTIASVGDITAASAPQHKRLEDAAQQFEGMFLQQMLKPLSEMGKDDADADGSDGGASTYQTAGTEAVAKAVARAGGLGIARHIVTEVERQTSRHIADHELAEKIRQP